MIKLILNYLKRLPVKILNTIKVYLNYKSPKLEKESYQKAIFIDIKRNNFTRAFYVFCKFFNMNGYQIFIPKKMLLLFDLSNNIYTNLLFKEKIINFGFPPSGHLKIDEQLLSNDYFSIIDRKENCYYIPFFQHPLMYHEQLWNKEIKINKRKKSLFMAGHFAYESYNVIERDGRFKSLSRCTVYDFLDKKSRLYKINSEAGLKEFLNSDLDNKVTILKRADHSIPQHKVREINSCFDFYFALSGVVMPLCHNIVEAMSVGTIPFLQDEYAELFDPPLTNQVNCIVFSGLEDLEERIDYLFKLSEHEIEVLRNNVINYYNQNFTPESVIKKIETNRYDKIYILAEDPSVRLLPKHKYKQ